MYFEVDVCRCEFASYGSNKALILPQPQYNKIDTILNIASDYDLYTLQNMYSLPHRLCI